LVAAAERHAAAAAGSLQLKDEAPDLLDGAGDVCHISGLAWRGLFGKPVSTAPKEDCEIFSPCAAAALYDRQAFIDLGGFYERFFCYYEDVDLGFRLRLSGHRAILAPRARVRHVGSASSGGRHSDFAVYHGFRNTVWAFAKNMPARALPYALPMHVGMICALLALNATRPTIRPALRGLRSALTGIRPVLRDRIALQARATPGANLLLSWNPFAPFTRPANTRRLAPFGRVSPTTPHATAEE
jgi:GT2 family glycosyltransferase